MHAVFTKYINILEPGMMFYHEDILPVLERSVSITQERIAHINVMTV